ncbi:hypothetical protein ACFWBB_30990 [Streptomyces sp. NPDC060000]|uniref:hypothetical protein n=1 Tax=Streptomyces sp. NPDC060000 TaxID=3347031 RepID=UPI0036AF1673
MTRDELRVVLRTTVDLMAQDVQAQTGVPVSMVDYLVGQAVEVVRGSVDTVWVRVLRESGREAAAAWSRVNEDLYHRACAVLIPEGAHSRPLTASRARALATPLAATESPAVS